MSSRFPFLSQLASTTLPRLFFGAVFVIAVAGCGTTTPVATTEPLQFDQAIAAATDSLFQQSQDAMGFMARRSIQKSAYPMQVFV